MRSEYNHVSKLIMIVKYHVSTLSCVFIVTDDLNTSVRNFTFPFDLYTKGKKE